MSLPHGKDTNPSVSNDAACPDSDKIQQTADLDEEGTIVGVGEVDTLGMIKRGIGSDLGQIGRCNHLHTRNLAFGVGAVVVGGNVMRLFHR